MSEQKRPAWMIGEPGETPDEDTPSERIDYQIDLMTNDILDIQNSLEPLFNADFAPPISQQAAQQAAHQAARLLVMHALQLMDLIDSIPDLTELMTTNSPKVDLLTD